MKITKILVALLVPMMMVGCASVKHNYTPATQAFSVPDVGETATTSIGDRMLQQGVRTEGEAIRLRSTQSIGIYEISPGIYRKTGDDAQHEFFSPVMGDAMPISAGLFKIPKPAMGLRIAKDGGRTCAVGLPEMTMCGDLSYERTDFQAEGAQNFQQTLVYSGKVGDKINVTYREYSGNMAREAFDNRVEYDLSESGVIGYKGARLKVNDADNSSITYEVLSAFN